MCETCGWIERKNFGLYMNSPLFLDDDGWARKRKQLMYALLAFCRGEGSISKCLSLLLVFDSSLCVRLFFSGFLVFWFFFFLLHLSPSAYLYVR